jgi:hypothetical protein
VHFYSNYRRFSRTNRGTMNYYRAGDAAPRRAAPASASGPTQTHFEVPHLPEVPRPEAGEHSNTP